MSRREEGKGRGREGQPQQPSKISAIISCWPLIYTFRDIYNVCMVMGELI